MLYGHLRTEHIVSRFFAPLTGRYIVAMAYSVTERSIAMSVSVCLSASMISAGADLEGMTRVTSHPPLAQQPIQYISNHAHVLTHKRSNFILP